MPIGSNAEARALGAVAADPSDASDASLTKAADGALEEAGRQAELARAYATYQRLLAANGCIDFGDQVALALRLVRTSASARDAIAGRFRYILVDEFQDTNRAQAELVAALAEGHRNVTVVGDDDQAIYAFRGAAVDNILDFTDRYVGARTIVLRRNYRSLAPILDAAYRLIRFNDPDRLEVRTGVVKRLRAQRTAPSPAPVRLEVFATGAEEADWIAAEIGRRMEAGAAPRDHAVLVRANGHADPDPAGPQRRRDPVALLGDVRAVCPAGGQAPARVPARRRRPRVERRPVRARGVGRLRARRRGPDRDRQHGAPPQPLGVGDPRGARATAGHPARLARHPDDRASARRPTCAATRPPPTSGPAGELLYRFLRGSGLLARLVGTDTPAAEEALQNIARFFEIVRSQSALLADDRAVFVAPHLATLIEAGDDPATAELDPDTDAVAVLTVHKAKGLEFPVVFLPGMVAGRFPSGGRGDPLALPAGLGRGVPPGPEAALAEERRLCYVAMTRARDELLLSHAADYGGARARRVSPFVLEALDLPVAAGIPGAGARSSTPVERLATFDATASAASAPDGPITEPLSLSFYQVDDYLTCPLKYKYAHVLRVPLAPHHAIIYGAALHKAVQLFHHRHAKGQVMSEAELDAAFEAAWSNEGFMSRDHEEARLTAGRAALRRFREAQLQPGAVIPTYVEREFAFMLGGDRVRGRWDRVDVVATESGAATGCGRARTCRERPTERRRGLADARDPGSGAGDDHRLQVVRRARPGQGAPTGARVAPAPDLRDGLRGDDRPAARRHRLVLPRVGPHRRGRGRPPAAGQGARADRHRRGRDAGARLHPEARLPGLHLLRVPRHLPVERRALSGPTQGLGRVPTGSVE